MAAAGRRFTRWAKGVEVFAFTVAKEQALDAQYELAKATPVDVGTARSNWRIAVSRPHTGTIGAYSPYLSRWKPPYGAGGSKSETSNLAAVVSQGKSTLSRYKKGSIYISNNLRYIAPLDKGHSSQSPAGFVSRAVMLAVSRTKPKIPPIFEREMSK